MHATIRWIQSRRDLEQRKAVHDLSHGDDGSLYAVHDFLDLRIHGLPKASHASIQCHQRDGLEGKALGDA